MKKILLLIPLLIICLGFKLEEDKAVHFSISTIITAGADDVLREWGIKNDFSRIALASAIGITPGYVKEKYIDSKFDQYDFRADLMGVAFGIFLNEKYGVSVKRIDDATVLMYTKKF